MRRLHLLLPLLLLAGCDPLSEEKDELRAARDRWNDAEIDSYSYAFEYSCLCNRAGYYAVVVENGVIVSAETIEEHDWPGREPYALTVPEMFDRIERALDDEADDVDLRFADEGYPTHAAFDMDERSVDDEWNLGVDDFVDLTAD